VENESILKEIEDIAGYFFTVDEVATITGADMEKPEYKKAYLRGSLKSEAEIRKIILQQAKDGSSPAQTTAQKMIEALKRKNH